jgi:Tfp pilus assembly protein PilV
MIKCWYKLRGFTLIEVIVFLIVSSILMSTILIGATTALRNTPTVHQQWIATQLARQCMEWFLGQRQFNGYSALSCPSTPSASACTSPSGYTVSTQIACTTWNSDTHYKTITVTVGGLSSTSLSTQIGDY